LAALRWIGWILLVAWTAGCTSPGGPRIAIGGRVALDVVIPVGSGVGLQHAAQDLAEALAIITGSARPARVVQGAAADIQAAAAVLVRLDHGAGTGPQGYRLSRPSAGVPGVEVVAETEQGGMYGLYHLLADLGVRYYHPEETFFPHDPGARLPQGYDGEVQRPTFALRGFHEHTQHPIPLSDFWLRTDDPAFRGYLTRYLRWLARNRQNAASFMLLKTVDLDTWLPYAASAIDEAHLYGIQVGFSISFVDQQQNAFKLLGDPGPGDDDAEPVWTGCSRPAPTSWSSRSARPSSPSRPTQTCWAG